MAKQQTSTAEQSVSKTKEEIIKEAKRMEESLLYSSKGHFAAAQIWNNFHLTLGIPLVILSAVLGASALTKFDSNHIIAGILSLITVALSSIMTFLNPNQKASAHMNAGNHYDALMNQTRIFWSIDCWGNDSEAVLTNKIKYFYEQKDKLNQNCPQIPRWAYNIAKRGIKAGEGGYTVDGD